MGKEMAKMFEKIEALALGNERGQEMMEMMKMTYESGWKGGQLWCAQRLMNAISNS